MGFRQLVWALIAALLIYGAWQFFRALIHGRRAATGSPQGSDSKRAARARKADEVDDPVPVEADDEDDGEVDDAGFDYAPMPSAPPAASSESALAATAATGSDPFTLEFELLRLRREMGALRAALDVQQEEIGALHDAVSKLTEAVPAPTQAVDAAPEVNASPEYNEALVLARRGYSVDEVAARCGITRAEAELVVSLAARGDTEGGA